MAYDLFDWRERSSVKLNVELEIDDGQLADIVRELVIEKVRDKAKSWLTEKAVTDAVKSGWDRGLSEMVNSEIANSDVLRKKVGLELERQIKNKLAAAIRLQEKGRV